MKNKIKFIILTLLITTLVGCKNPLIKRNSSSTVEVNKELKKEEKTEISTDTKVKYYEYLKLANEKTMDKLKKQYKISGDEDIDKNYVIMGDPYYDIYRTSEDSDEYVVDIESDTNKIVKTTKGFNYMDILFPENIKTKQLIVQKMRKDFIDNTMNEDYILNSIQYMLEFGLKADKEEMKLKGQTESEWYRDKAINQLLYDNSTQILQDTYENILNVYLYAELSEVFGEDFKNVQDYDILSQFGETSNLKRFNDLVTDKESHIESLLNEPEIDY